ncbi:MAG: hypothetical protein RIQ60_3873 [Pseudomonadota bacterium]|jgi:DNA-directed RNA polymerase specialized sigma24 family protein
MPPDSLLPDDLQSVAVPWMPPPGPRYHAALQAEQASRWARDGGPAGLDRAAALLLRNWGARLVRYFVQHGRVTDGVAEELAADAILNFVLEPAPDGCPADVWLWSMARHRLIDHARAQGARKRGGRGAGPSSRSQAGALDAGRGGASEPRSGAVDGPIELALDDEAWLAVLDHLPGHVELAPWVRDCVHKAAALMERDEPRHAQVLWMVAQGWSAEEIAVYFGAPPDALHERHRTAARDRVYRACRSAREHFAHCRE